MSVELIPAPATGTRHGPRGRHVRVGGALAGATPFIPAALLLAIWTGSVSHFGSYFPVHWYLWTLATTVLFITVVLAGGRLVPASRHAQLALAGLAAWIAWNYISILWADAPGPAWDAANKLLMYLTGAWTLALLPWRPRPAIAMLGAWSLALAGVGALSLWSALSASELTDFFIDGRYAEPFGYPNGVAAAAALGMVPALALSARREVPVPLQAVFLGVAVFLVELALLPQSRGALLGVAAAVPVLVILSPDRLKLVPRVAVMCGALALTAHKIIDISDATTRTSVISPVLDEAVDAMVLTVVVAAAAGLVISLIERYVKLGERGTRRVTRTMTAGLILGALAAVAVLAVSASRISSVANDAWGNFQTGTSDDSGAHITSTGDPQRYDYWSAAYHLFLENPVSGVGAGNFEHHYAARRDYEKHSRYAHNLGFRIISENGLPGALAFLAFIGAFAAGVLAAQRRLDPAGKAVIATCAGVLVYFLVHASLDWLDEFPPLAGPAFALPFVGLALLPASSRRFELGARMRRVAAVAITALLVAALASVAVPYLSYRYVARGHALAGEHRVDRAFDDFERARSLNPLTVEPDLARGTLAVRLGREAEARAAFEAALTREANWYAHFELSLLALHHGRFERAAEELAIARRLNVNDPVLYELARRIRHRKRVDPQRFNRLALDQSLFETDRLR